MTAHRTIGLLAALAFAGSGCAPEAYRSLVSENEVPTLDALVNRADDRATTVHLIATALDGGPDVVIAIHETGNLSAERTVVMLHGVMSDHRTWRFVSGDLGTDHRLLLVDLPGSGASDKPRPEALEPRGYGPEAIAERTLQALESVLRYAHIDDNPITLVGHSFGGTVALRMFGQTQLRDRYQSVLDRVDRLVLLAPADVEIETASTALEQLSGVGGLAVTLGDITGLLETQVAHGARESVCDPDIALREEADRICDILTNPSTRRAHQAMLKQARPQTANGEVDRAAIRRIVSEYGSVDVPCLIVWGSRDAALPVSMGYKFMYQIPDSELYVVEDCQHSLQIEHPSHCAAVIRRFGSIGTFGIRANSNGSRVFTARVGE